MPREKRDRRDKKDKKKKFKRFKQRVCRFTRLKVEFVDWKDVATLQRLSTGQGKILGRKRSGTCALFQRKVKTAIQRARFMGLMPYVGT